MTHQLKPEQWVRYNHLTNTYDTPDGTRVASEITDNVTCLADVVRIAQIREEQRTALTTEGGAA